ncbi:hypothetical protein ERJ70_16100 [Sediminibacillus dalangtanensis]|uniref:Uncharacterized protein n=1 Tax=Sediminibacillus dalangtanensis TaxID=2729421 RepID=A0ABX7W0X9_9BACI|nr:hypothetical protein [Sediminibacillus dalangtanensis]QTN00678.1 hypothetical protein ERJ70_16100 [Sediminibacillus dalangtanensis]
MRKENDYKAMQWFGYVIILLSLLADRSISEFGRGPVFGFSYFACIGIVLGATITFVYSYKAKRITKKIR